MTKDYKTAYPERKYFERGLNLLKECIENESIHFPRDAHFVDSLTRVKVLPNGRMDLLTVDELVRSSFLILASGQMDKCYEAKE